MSAPHAVAMSDPGFGIYNPLAFLQVEMSYATSIRMSADRIDDARWRDGLLTELDRARRPAGAPCQSIFFGGGTPR